MYGRNTFDEMGANRDREEAIFDAARELESASERAAYLAEQCGKDAELRQRVEGMLEAFGRPLQSTCTACFTGIYPVEIEEEEREKEHALDAG